MAKGTVNKVIILGRLGQDPDVRSTSDGTQVVNLNVATNELGPKDEQGNRLDSTEWHRIVIFGRMAENAATYLRKGAQVYIEGRLQTRKWQDQNGVEKYSTEIVANEMQFIGGKSDGQGQTPRQQPQGQPQQPQGGQPARGFGQNTGQPAPAPQNNSDAGGYNDFDDDIPFN